LPVQIAFVLLTLLGVILSSSYARLTPDLYEGNSHGRVGWFIVFFVAALLGLDVVSFAVRLVKWFKGPRDFSGFFRMVLGTDDNKGTSDYERVTLDETQPLARDSDDVEDDRRRDSSPQGIVDEEGRWSGSSSDSSLAGSAGAIRASTAAPGHPSPLRHGASTQQRRTHRPELSLNMHVLPHERRDTLDSLRSGRSDATLHDQHNIRYSLHATGSPDELDFEKYGAGETDEETPRDTRVSLATKLRIAAKYMHIFCLRILLVFGYTQLLSGIAVYSGTCRGAYLNGCMAHLIKGSIFFLYVSSCIFGFFIIDRHSRGSDIQPGPA
jgi:hypothetical protein